MKSHDAAVEIALSGRLSETLPRSSRFGSVEEASAFFESGSLGYSVTSDARRLDGIMLKTVAWRVRPLEITNVRSSYFGDAAIFPAGSVEFDHALFMSNVAHEWHSAGDLWVA